MNTSQKLCLQWNDFNENVSSSFRELREDKELTDVTLACEDGKQVEVHKVVLASSSPFFMDILKNNKHPHPLIYMRGLKSENLLAIVDFLYLGEANIFQEDLDSFLALAEELSLKGLTGTGDLDKVKEPPIETKPNFKNVPEQTEKAKQPQRALNDEYQLYENSDTAIAVQSHAISTVMQDLDEQIKSMMTKTNVKLPNGQGYVVSCNICGKEAPSKNMPSHIEANHITGVSHACDICGKVSRSRQTLRMHKHRYHQTLLQDQN